MQSKSSHLMQTYTVLQKRRELGYVIGKPFIIHKVYKFLAGQYRTQSGYSLKHRVITCIHTRCKYMTAVQYSINESNNELMYLLKIIARCQCQSDNATSYNAYAMHTVRGDKRLKVAH